MDCCSIGSLVLLSIRVAVSDDGSSCEQPCNKREETEGKALAHIAIFWFLPWTSSSTVSSSSSVCLCSRACETIFLVKFNFFPVMSLQGNRFKAVLQPDGDRQTTNCCSFAPVLHSKSAVHGILCGTIIKNSLLEKLKN